MTQHAQGISDAVSSVASEQAAWAHHAARLLAVKGFQTRVLPTAEDETEWYVGSALAFRPAPNARAAIGAAGEELVAALAKNDALLSEIEGATGLAAEFKDHGPLPSNSVKIVLTKAGSAVGEIAALALPPREVPKHAYQSLPLIFAAARLSIEEAHQLANGDMLLLSNGAWPLLDEMGRVVKAGMAFDPVLGAISNVPTLQDMNLESATMADPADGNQMSVPVAVQLTDTVLTEAELARLAQDGSVDLGAVSDGLHASVSVGGRTIGRGQIVRIGDRFAVLLEDASEPAIDEEQPVQDDVEVSPNELEAEHD